MQLQLRKQLLALHRCAHAPTTLQQPKWHFSRTYVSCGPTHTKPHSQPTQKKEDMSQCVLCTKQSLHFFLHPCMPHKWQSGILLYVSFFDSTGERLAVTLSVQVALVTCFVSISVP
jgi:hypothetical protein